MMWASSSAGTLALDVVQESAEFLRMMTAMQFADHMACCEVESGEQRSCAMPSVIMSPALYLSGSQRSIGCVRSRALIWLFSSTQNTTACSGGIHVQTGDVPHF